MPKEFDFTADWELELIQEELEKELSSLPWYAVFKKRALKSRIARITSILSFS